MKRIALLQSNYIPWKGNFDLIAAVDEFILYDDMQYTRRDWRNRNLIKTPHGLKWLTIPVEVKGKYFQKICETKVSDLEWAPRHWDMLRQNYRKAACFRDVCDQIESIYLGNLPDYLHEINFQFLRVICGMLGIQTPITWSMDYHVAAESKTERLVELCRRSGATHYLSGPSARDYIDDVQFARAGIALEYADYAGYPEYPQLHETFEHGVSVLDLLFNTGADAPKYMKMSGNGCIVGASWRSATHVVPQCSSN